MNKEIKYLSDKIQILENKISTLNFNKKNFTTKDEIKFYNTKKKEIQEEKKILQKILKSLVINKNIYSDKLVNDYECKQSFISSIAICQIDAEKWYRKQNNKIGKYLNTKDKHAIANKGAEYFIYLLSK
jgi:hypothetical protein